MYNIHDLNVQIRIILSIHIISLIILGRYLMDLVFTMLVIFKLLCLFIN